MPTRCVQNSNAVGPVGRAHLNGLSQLRSESPTHARATENRMTFCSAWDGGKGFMNRSIEKKKTGPSASTYMP